MSVERNQDLLPRRVHRPEAEAPSAEDEHLQQRLTRELHARRHSPSAQAAFLAALPPWQQTSAYLILVGLSGGAHAHEVWHQARPGAPLPIASPRPPAASPPRDPDPAVPRPLAATELVTLLLGDLTRMNLDPQRLMALIAQAERDALADAYGRLCQTPLFAANAGLLLEQLTNGAVSQKLGSEAALREELVASFGEESRAIVLRGDAAQLTSAEAMTADQVIHLPAGETDPRQPEHRARLGHEIAHALQQMRSAGGELSTGERDAAEAEAEAAGQSFARAQPFQVVGHVPRTAALFRGSPLPGDLRKLKKDPTTTKAKVDPVLNDAKIKAADQREVAQDEGLTGWLRTLYAPDYVPAVFRQLGGTDPALPGLSRKSSALRGWLVSDTQKLDKLIAASGKGTAWLGALLASKQGAAVEEMSSKDAGTWKPIYSDFAAGGAAADKKTLLKTPAVLEAAVKLLGVSDAPLFLDQLGAKLIQGANAIKVLASDHAMLAFVGRPRFTTKDQEAAINDAAFPPLIPSFGKHYIDQVFPNLTKGSGALPRLFGKSKNAHDWMVADHPELEKRVAKAGKDLKLWIGPLIAKKEGTLILEGAAADGAGWRTAIKSVHAFLRVMAMDPQKDAIPQRSKAEQGLWELYGPPGSRGPSNLKEREATFARLYKTKLMAKPGWSSVPAKFSNPPNAFDVQFQFHTLKTSEPIFDTMMDQFRTLPRAHVNTANVLALGDGSLKYRLKKTAPTADKAWSKWTLKKLDTAFWQPLSQTVVLDVRKWAQAALPGTKDVGGASQGPQAVGGAGSTSSATTLTYFQNHATHEMGHAVGARTLVVKGKYSGTSGDQFAWTYGGWRKVAEAEVQTALWAGKDSTPPKYAVKADKAARFLLDLMQNKKATLPPPPVDWPKGKAWKDASAWSEIQTQYSGEELTKFIAATGGLSRGLPYQFPDYTPAKAQVYIFCAAMNSLASYDKFLWEQRKALSWYALSAPRETFAEMYTAKYATKAALPPPHRGLDPTAFFTELDTATDADLLAKAPEPVDASKALGLHDWINQQFRPWP